MSAVRECVRLELYARQKLSQPVSLAGLACNSTRAHILTAHHVWRRRTFREGTGYMASEREGELHLRVVECSLSISEWRDSACTAFVSVGVTVKLRGATSCPMV